MCGGNPAKDQAKIEKHKKDYAYRSKSTQWKNKEASWKKSHNRNVIGFSRGKSDIQSKALTIVGKGRQLKQQAVTSYAIKESQVKAAEGGRSRTAGRGDYLQLLAKQAQIESKINNTLGRDHSSAMQGVTRNYLNKVATNRQKLGLPPEYGPRVMYTKPSLWERLAPVRQVAGLVVPFMGSSV